MLCSTGMAYELYDALEIAHYQAPNTSDCTTGVPQTPSLSHPDI